MAKENDCADCDKFDIATLKNELAASVKKVDELTAQGKDMQTKLDEATKVAKAATDSLNQYRDAEKKALVDSVVKRTDFKVDDLKEKSVEDLRNIHQALDHFKVDGTVKPVRGTGADNKVEVDLRKPNDAILSIGRPERQADGSIKWVVPE